MLNKKAQTEDTTEIIVAVILLIIGVAIMYFLTFAHGVSLMDVKDMVVTPKDKILSVDSKSMGTDLTNTLRLPITEEYTFGEILAMVPENHPDVKDSWLVDEKYFDQTLFTDRLFCDQTLKNKLIAYLNPVYDDEWFIKVYEGEDLIFVCYDAGIQWGEEVKANITIPTTDPSQTLLVDMEVRV
tara:strand:- start:2558 stop:3109 length:552 start_codon:yes stop_codon:yes gene_type:complete